MSRVFRRPIYPTEEPNFWGLLVEMSLRLAIGLVLLPLVFWWVFTGEDL